MSLPVELWLLVLGILAAEKSEINQQISAIYLRMDCRDVILLAVWDFRDSCGLAFMAGGLEDEDMVADNAIEKWYGTLRMRGEQDRAAVSALDARLVPIDAGISSLEQMLGLSK